MVGFVGMGWTGSKIIRPFVEKFQPGQATAKYPFWGWDLKLHDKIKYTLVDGCHTQRVTIETGQI
jgi:hypothetical protein